MKIWNFANFFTEDLKKIIFFHNFLVILLFIWFQLEVNYVYEESTFYWSLDYIKLSSNQFVMCLGEKDIKMMVRSKINRQTHYKEKILSNGTSKVQKKNQLPSAWSQRCQSKINYRGCLLFLNHQIELNLRRTLSLHL